MAKKVADPRERESAHRGPGRTLRNAGPKWWDRLPRWLRDEIGPPPPRTTVTVADLERELSTRRDPALHDALTQFGELMLSEVTNRTTMLDSKAVSLLGWTSALLALWVGTWTQFTAFPYLEVAVVTLGAVAAAIALLASSSALRVRRWCWP